MPLSYIRKLCCQSGRIVAELFEQTLHQLACSNLPKGESKRDPANLNNFV